MKKVQFIHIDLHTEDELKNLLEYLIPHTVRAEFGTVTFLGITAKTMKACSPFFDGKVIYDFTFKA